MGIPSPEYRKFVEMTDCRRFIQFPHPHEEHNSRSGSIWHETKTSGGKKKPHRRKFMEFQGKWAERGGATHCDTLWGWGEWEPESTLLPNCIPKASDRWQPRQLWKPYYVQRPDYKHLHSTDPLIFGGQFLYSNCHQANYPKLKQLARGSVIAFGSGSKCGWMLDTVFVVSDFIRYEINGDWTRLKRKVQKEFLHVTGGPLLANDGEDCSPDGCARGDKTLRLYLGATPEHPVDGMFSFFPATRGDKRRAFARPFIFLPGEYFNRESWRTPKGQEVERSPAELVCLWNRLVKQVHDQELVLGTFAELPKCQHSCP